MADDGAPARLAQRLQAALAKLGVPCDVWPLRSGRYAISVGPGLMPLTDGNLVWWVVPAGIRSPDGPRVGVYSTIELAAKRLAPLAAALRTPEVVLDARPQ
ncbi:hypothetical protein GCM10017673_38960 [Streptosporangium violaceochromogenes]|nr:hypothetical protein GCM10017673_38960 [Streptosporangium violaceochromogenes]